MSGDDDEWDVTATGGDLASLDATVTLSFASGQDIQDLAGNALTDTTPSGDNDNTYVIDNTAPTVEITGVPASTTSAFTATFTFNETVTGFGSDDVTLTNATEGTFTNTAAGTTWTLGATPDGNGNYEVAVAASAATDTAGNAVAATSKSGTYAADSAAPSVTSVARQSPSSSPTNADAVTWRVTFSEEVTNVGSGDFSIAGTGIGSPTLAVSAVTGQSNAQWDVKASGGNLATLDATVTLSFASGQDVEDLAGNALSSTTPTGDNDNTYVLDNTAPTVTITGVPAATTAHSPRPSRSARR